MDAAWDLHGQYSTDVFSEEAVKIVEDHNTTNPLFLYMAHAAVHSANTYNPLPAPDEVVDSFKEIESFQRRKFAGIILAPLYDQIELILLAHLHEIIILDTY